MIKSLLRNSIAAVYSAMNRRLPRLEGKIVILAYHRVVTERELKQSYIQPGMYVRDDVFEKQMNYVAKHFTMVSFPELLDGWENKTLDARKKYCTVTFDDGWLDNYINAFPILLKYGIPATIFLPADFVGKDMWMWPDKLGCILWRIYHDQALVKTDTPQKKLLYQRHQWLLSPSGRTIGNTIEEAIERVKEMPSDDIENLLGDLQALTDVTCQGQRLMLNWSEVEEMSRKGVAFGSHSYRHRILTLLSDEEARHEIEDSSAMLAGRKGINYVPAFCYPNGNFNRAIADRLKIAGYRAAVSTQFGVEDRSPRDLFGLKRIGIHNDVSNTIPLFIYRISGRTTGRMFSLPLHRALHAARPLL